MMRVLSAVLVGCLQLGEVSLRVKMHRLASPVRRPLDRWHSVCVASGLPTVDDSVSQPETENEPGSTKGSQTIPGDSGQHNRKSGLRC